jgi:hypothetical protein
MPGIEFLPESPDGIGSDEELAGGPRRSLPRWVAAAAVAALMVAAAVTAVVRNDSRPLPPAAAPHAVSGTDRTGGGLRYGLPLGAGAGSPVLDVAASSSSIWVLQSDAVRSIGPRGRLATARLPGRFSSGRLRLDVTTDRLWVVGADRVLEYRAQPLGLLRAVAFPTGVGAAAALDGGLYLSERGRLLALVPGQAAVRTVAAVPAEVVDLAADPSRHRVLVGLGGHPARVMAVSGPVQAPSAGRPVPAGVLSPSLAVADDVIWLAGTDADGATLMRLDPASLRAVHDSSVGLVLDPPPVLVAGGGRTVWLRNGGTLLRCIDADSGFQQEVWQIAGPVASVLGRAVVGTAHGLVDLELNWCPG